MRIAFVHPNLSPRGGVESQIHGLATALADAGHEVHAVCERVAADVDPRIHRHRVPRLRGAPRAARVWLFDTGSRRALRRAGPFDVVQGFGKTSVQDVYRDGSGCLADYQEYSLATLPEWRRALGRAGPHARVVARIERARYTRGHFRRIVAISELVRGQILQRHGLTPGEVEVLHPAVDLERFHPRRAARARPEVRAELALPPDARLVVQLGSDYRRKGLAVLLRALAALPEAQLLVLGRDRRAARYAELAARLGIAERTHFLGPRPDPERWLAAADCFAFPSLFDAFGVSVLEALASGVPAVVSRRAGAAEVIAPGENGAVVDPEDPDALAAGIRPFLEPARRAAAAAAARAEAERHGFAAQAEHMLEIYRAVSRAGASATAPCTGRPRRAP